MNETKINPRVKKVLNKGKTHNQKVNLIASTIASLVTAIGYLKRYVINKINYPSPYFL